MNVFEEINRDRILLKAWFNLYCGSILQYINLPSPVIFMDMGIGNIANMKPVINFFVKPVCLISEPFREEAIKTLYPHAQIWHINKEPPAFNHVCICNFLNQRKWQIEFIIKHQFEHRIGHYGDQCTKWRKIFNYHIPFDICDDEIKSNNNLLKPIKNENYDGSDRDKRYLPDVDTMERAY